MGSILSLSCFGEYFGAYQQGGGDQLPTGARAPVAFPVPFLEVSTLMPPALASMS
jgi:hypothetical protein